MNNFINFIEKSQLDYKQYQYDGVEWCINREKKDTDTDNKIYGGIVADEMGLGKTITMIGLMLSHPVRRTLIVLPIILVDQWYDQILKLTGHSTLIYDNNNKSYFKKEDINKASVLITTYNMLSCRNCLLDCVTWDRVIYDEAHHLKNKHTQTFKKALELKRVNCWLITGTPIQNNRNDLFNLLAVLGINQNVYSYRDTCQGRPLVIIDNIFQNIIKNFILKRTKQQVGIELEPIKIVKYQIEWKNEHEKALAEDIHAIIPKATNVVGNPIKEVTQAFRNLNLPIGLIGTIKAKQMCVMGSLLRKNIELFKSRGLIRADYSEALNCSSKIDAIIKHILHNKNNGCGKLIFCQYIEEIDIIKKRLHDSNVDNVYSYDGRNTEKDLLNAIKFADIIIMQIQSSCEGLNLQERFSEIYLGSLHWNPFIEEQALARCHRIGQKKNVILYKFIMKGFKEVQEISLDKYILNKHKQKYKINDTYLKYASTLETKEDLLVTFNLKYNECCVCLENTEFATKCCRQHLCKLCYDVLLKNECPMCRTEDVNINTIVL